MSHWKKYRFKNLTFFIISLVLGLVLARFEPFHALLLNLGEFGYFSAFLVGILLVSTFTMPTGIIMLLVLAERYSVIELGLIAGLGSMIGDFIIFRIVKDRLLEELTPLYELLGGKQLTILLHTKYFRWTLPVIGALAMASPLPDEIGVSLLGLSRMKTYKFIFLSFIFNAVGVIFILSASSFIKP
jgi:uncharacterized membrane protein YdjX (TVP38/TMEM64 family)